VLDGIKAITGKKPLFVQLDLRDKKGVIDFFKTHNDHSGVIHFAASKAVGESVHNPLLYYENNLNSLIYVLQALQKQKASNFIFSSSCTVYGEPDQLPITETAPIKKAQSPYGNTKQIGEEIISDTCKVIKTLNAVSLRYFNPIGAHESVEIGELPIGTPQNLVPFITQTAIGKRAELSVFGDDYPTEDGTCIRDYIHVVDLAKAHVAALKRLNNSWNTTNYEVFNIGTGKGASVLEVIKTFERVSGEKLKFKIVDRRVGDSTESYADTTKATNILGWKAKLSLNDALSSAWKWEQQLNKKENT
tara:strand:+ start:84 stop:995 length:912 start_codon:yes stop_codon:yes gene_type:complete